MVSNKEVLDQRVVEGEPMGTGWKIVSSDKITIDSFETKTITRLLIHRNAKNKYSRQMRSDQHKEQGHRMLSMVYVVSPVGKATP